nr:hypothetical protein GCM10017547_13080 [Pseudarthrobacter oxydans]
MFPRIKIRPVPVEYQDDGLLFRHEPLGNFGWPWFIHHFFNDGVSRSFECPDKYPVGTHGLSKSVRLAVQLFLDFMGEVIPFDQEENITSIDRTYV